MAFGTPEDPSEEEVRRLAIPHDVIRRIVAHAQPADLVPSLRASKELHDLASPFVHHSITFHYRFGELRAESPRAVNSGPPFSERKLQQIALVREVLLDYFDLAPNGAGLPPMPNARHVRLLLSSSRLRLYVMADISPTQTVCGVVDQVATLLALPMSTARLDAIKRDQAGERKTHLTGISKSAPPTNCDTLLSVVEELDSLWKHASAFRVVKSGPIADITMIYSGCRCLGDHDAVQLSDRLLEIIDGEDGDKGCPQLRLVGFEQARGTFREMVKINVVTTMTRWGTDFSDAGQASQILERFAAISWLTLEDWRRERGCHGIPEKEIEGWISRRCLTLSGWMEFPRSRRRAVGVVTW